MRSRREPREVAEKWTWLPPERYDADRPAGRRRVPVSEIATLREVLIDVDSA
jgi:hypothetical protein